MPDNPVTAIAKAAQRTVEAAAEAAKQKLADVTRPDVPGAPAPEPPSLEEPTTPRGPLPPKPDQAGPDRLTPTGYDTGAPPTAVGQQGAYLTTAHGTPLRETDHSLKAGRRGPTLLQDHHLREKIHHFDHERIPERVVHARGAGAHGVFHSYGNATNLSRAGLFAEGKETDVFVRFSTVLGSRGSADTVRDTRGFATRFYSEEGNWDLIGNNIPVFFIQDGIKFPDVIHAGKPHPDREIPQAQSAHDTFWDFVSLHTEAQHHAMWNMSDRGLARSYRMMEGFGVHTFRLVDAEGATSLVKFHWKPVAGVHSLTWEEAQTLAGNDPDFHRRDLADAIESGAQPQWELGLQVFEDTPDQTFAGIDLLDSTKLVPEELAPVQAVGMMTLTHNPTNYFAETEQIGFSLGNLVPGIGVTDDPLLQARLFSYNDTQLTRLGGPNWNQLPINRAHAPVNDMLRDGYGQQAVHVGVAAYKPNTLDGGCPFLAGDDVASYSDAPVVVAAGHKVRESHVTYDDHFSQARLFWQSMTAVEKEHIVAAYSFELSKVFEQVVKERQLRALANIDPVLCREVARAVGLPAPEPSETLTSEDPSPALSQLGGTWPVDGRQVGVVVDADGDLEGVEQAVADIRAAGMVALVVAAHGGTLSNGMTVQRTFNATRSVEYDALVIASAPPPAPDALPGRDAKAGAGGRTLVDPRVDLMVDEALRHAKAIGAYGEGVQVLSGLGLDDVPGVVSGAAASEVVAEVVGLLGSHRVWERFPSRLG